MDVDLKCSAAVICPIKLFKAKVGRRISLRKGQILAFVACYFLMKYFQVVVFQLFVCSV
jgi:hypothetical protein